MVDEIYFVIVIRRVESIQEYADKSDPKIWVACICENYSDAETFQKMVVSSLNHADIAVVVGANLSSGEGIVDIKAVLEDEVN